MPHDAGDAPDLDLDALATLAVDTARAAGALLLERLHGVRRSVETKSSGTDMVTEVDRDSEALIVNRLRAARPDDGFLGEESGTSAGTSDLEWVVDPLDGTTNYLYGFPAFAVSIAARRAGETLVGVVHDVVHAETFRAVRGGGAFVGDRPIHVSAKADLPTALVGTGFGYRPEERADAARVLLHVAPRVRDVRRAGAAALDLCWVACGRLDAFYERGLEWWDLAAGDLIVREAGGRTAAFDGGPIAPGSVLAATPGLLGPLQALLRDAGALG